MTKRDRIKQARKGGEARAASMTKRQRTASARKAARARWAALKMQTAKPRGARSDRAARVPSQWEDQTMMNTKDRRRIEDRRRIAYHEAGHAVFIATALDGGWAKGRLGTVKIHKRGGHTEHTSGMKINDRISCLLMGAAASLHAAPRKTMFVRFMVNAEARQDFERAKELIAEYQPIAFTFKVHFETAERWVEGLWDEITRVAEALIERGSLTGAQVRKLVRRPEATKAAA